MAVAPRCFLIQWEDRLMSIIEYKRIVSPLKKATEYKEGELIKAEFAKKIYEAVICEISTDKKLLASNAKLPPKYRFDDVKYKSQRFKESDAVCKAENKVSTLAKPVQSKAKVADSTPADKGPMLSSSDLVPTLGSNDKVPTLGSNDKVPTLGSNDQVPTLGSKSNDANHKQVGQVTCPLLVKPSSGLQTSGKVISSEVSRKEFDDICDQVSRLKKRVRELEKDAKYRREPTSPPEKRQYSPSEVPIKPDKISPVTSPANDVQHYNGHTEMELRSMIEHVDGLFNSCKKLLLALFPNEYIISHSVTGRRANTMTEPKPKFDSRLYDCFSKLIKEKFHVKDTEITLKVQSVQKLLKKSVQ